jgi:hypothetical protein
MKKSSWRIVPVVIFTAIAAMLAAQNSAYKPFPETYGKWIVHETDWGAPSCPHSDDFWAKYEMKGDTVVGAHSYKKVYVANNIGYPDANGVLSYGPNNFSFGYRNDSINKKVFYLLCSGGTNKDILWFDFNLDVGDTLPNTYAYEPFSGIPDERAIVSSVDSVKICGRNYKRFKFGCSGGFNTSLIEGQGFEDRFFKTAYSGCPFEACTTYGTTFAHCDVTGITKIHPEKLNFTLLPNPVSELLTVKADKIFITESTILDSSGQVILRHNQETTIEVNALSPGLYLIKLKSEQGEFCQKFIKE